MIIFFNTFLSYFILAIIFAIVAFVGVKVGIILRKKKNNKQEALVADSPDTTENQ